ncbi:hypothetical protein V496_07504 [Pseudogymnoascus sp. VKM F-4515 (FW-2607)]|nr:hypothetical protein V496_07504 [Pseudogymnoascus sp. VKM F-4515 (FW-2607)]
MRSDAAGVAAAIVFARTLPSCGQWRRRPARALVPDLERRDVGVDGERGGGGLLISSPPCFAPRPRTHALTSLIPPPSPNSLTIAAAASEPSPSQHSTSLPACALLPAEHSSMHISSHSQLCADYRALHALTRAVGPRHGNPLGKGGEHWNTAIGQWAEFTGPVDGGTLKVCTPPIASSKATTVPVAKAPPSPPARVHRGSARRADVRTLGGDVGDEGVGVVCCCVVLDSEGGRVFELGLACLPALPWSADGAAAATAAVAASSYSRR